MQLPRPISIDMLDFLRDGRFDCIEPAKRKNGYSTIFPIPMENAASPTISGSTAT